MRLAMVAGSVVFGLLAGCTPKPLPPDPTADALREHGAKLIPGSAIADRLTDKTLYGTIAIDTNTAKAGDAWTEYFGADGQLWYRDTRTTFHGYWHVPDDKDELCLTFREGEDRCAQLFELGDTIRFVSTAQGPYQGRSTSYADKVTDGDAEGFVPKPPEPRQRKKRR
jgi:hypothetical protein